MLLVGQWDQKLELIRLSPSVLLQYCTASLYARDYALSWTLPLSGKGLKCSPRNTPLRIFKRGTVSLLSPLGIIRMCVAHE